MKKTPTRTIEALLTQLPFERLMPRPGEPFGIYRLSLAEGCADIAILQPGTVYTAHRHVHGDAELHILRGSGVAFLDGEAQRYEMGTVVHVPRGTWHGFRTHTETVFLSLQNKPILDKATGAIDLEYQQPAEEQREDVA